MPPKPGAYNIYGVNKDDPEFIRSQKEKAAILAEFGETKIENLQYARLVQDWLRCTHTYIDEL